MFFIEKEISLRSLSESKGSKFHVGVNIFLIVVLLCSLAVFNIINTSIAHAAPTDLVCPSVSSGVTCKQFQDEAGVSIWCYSYNSSSLYNTYMQMCVRSLVFSGTGDGRRYALFNIQQINSPDTNNGVRDYFGGSADTTSSGNYSTMEARLWSLARSNCSTACDQENYDGLEPSSNCDPNGGSLSIGLTGKLGSGSFGWTETDPLFYGCTMIPSSDLYSQYYDYTLMQSDQQYTKLKSDFTFAQWAPNGFNNNWIEIGLSGRGHFMNPFNNWLSSGNLYDNYKY
jgi:hypothetical protein